MYAVRGNWVGQTLALATSNDSGGRKSRIRRSKEERKTMVESFIKRYQSLNGGKFPSLNLTHKEVGGSFYTVREIVREIIQENKVLGPARYNPEVDKDNTIVADYPLGSISREPQGIWLQAESETNVASNYQEKENVEQTLDAFGHCNNHQDLDSFQLSSASQTNKIDENLNKLACRKLATGHLVISSHQEHKTLELSLHSNGQYCDENEMDNSQFLNISQTNGVCDDKLLMEERPVKEKFDEDGNLGSVGACNGKLTLPTEEVEVETFPLKSAVRKGGEVGITSTVFKNLNGSLNNLETKQDVLSNSSRDLDDVRSSDNPSDQVETNRAVGSEFLNLDRDSGAVTLQTEVNDMLNHAVEVNVRAKASEMPDSSTIENVHMNQGASNGDLSIKTSEQRRKLAGLQGITHMGNSSTTSGKDDGKESICMSTSGNDRQIDDLSTKGSFPSLDRINLESWPGTSKQETNPMLTFIKAFVDAFVKFWSK